MVDLDGLECCEFTEFDGERFNAELFVFDCDTSDGISAEDVQDKANRMAFIGLCLDASDSATVFFTLMSKAADGAMHSDVCETYKAWHPYISDKVTALLGDVSAFIR